MPYYDNHIKAETSEEYQELILKLREEQEILEYQIEQAHKIRSIVNIGYSLLFIIMVALILYVR